MNTEVTDTPLPGAVALPAIGAAFSGGIFAGITLHDDKLHALVLLPDDGDDMEWPDALEFAVLEHAQDFHLRERAHVRDFVEEKRALAGELKLPFDGCLRSGEGAALMAEELALDQGVAHRGSVEGDERALGATGGIVDRVGEEGFAGPGFA